MTSALDSQIEALEAEAAAARRALVRFLESELAQLDGRPVPIVELCSKVIGGVWGSPEGESEVDMLALGPRVYSFGSTTLVTTDSPVRSFTAKQVADRRVRDGDIILERSGGSPEQPVGRVVIASDGLEPCVPTDFQRLLRPDTEKVVPRFLFWHLQADWDAGISTHYSRRTTGITNLSIKEYIAREVSVPTMGEQEAIVEGADGIDAVAQALSAEVAALRSVRSNLLTALLSQEIEIPSSYDDLLARP